MNKPLDLRGKRIGMLTVIKEFGKANDGHILWVCKCDCGNETVVASNKLSHNTTKSCGCIKQKASAEAHTTHGQSKTRLFKIWSGMKKRCFSSTCASYSNYGARGITVCDEWKNDFAAFKSWADESGYSDSLSIDRIDVNGNYEPNNCRWATNKEQSRNRRSNHCIEYNGENKTISEWSERLGIERDSLRSILLKHGDVEGIRIAFGGVK